MTTSIDIKANHGWPVRFTAIDPTSETELPNHSGIVKAGDVLTVSVHSTMDIRIHEIQPSEPEFALHKAESKAE